MYTTELCTYLGGIEVVYEVILSRVFHDRIVFMGRRFVNVGYFFFYAVTHPSALRLASGKVVKDSLKFKPNTHLVCERIRIQGYSRCRSLKKYAHIVKVKVEVETNPKIFSQNAEICFHRQVFYYICQIENVFLVIIPYMCQ